MYEISTDISCGGSQQVDREKYEVDGQYIMPRQETFKVSGSSGTKRNEISKSGHVLT